MSVHETRIQVILAPNFRNGSKYGKFILNGLHRDQSLAYAISYSANVGVYDVNVCQIHVLVMISTIENFYYSKLKLKILSHKWRLEMRSLQL